MKLISKKFVKELSKIVDCNICFQCIKNPIECNQCQNIWCKDCIAKNEEKCPNKCIDARFVKPHRIFRLVINEVYIECDACQSKVKQIDQEAHKQSKQCLEAQRKKRKVTEQLRSEKPIRKIVKREEKQKIQQVNYEEDQDTDDSLNNIFSRSINIEQGGSPHQESNNNEIINNCDISDIFSDEQNSQTTLLPQSNIKIEKTNNCNYNSLSDYLDIQQSNFKMMQISLFQEGMWKPLEYDLNTQVNFEVVKYMTENESLQDMIVQIKNTVFDFSKFEAYELFESLRVLDNDDSELENGRQCYSVGIEKKKSLGKIRIFDSQSDFMSRVKVYFQNDTDIIYYQNQDQKNILLSFFDLPTSTLIKTTRSDVNLNAMKEYNNKKMRDIKFELSF